jgi:hypothetical protein
VKVLEEPTATLYIDGDTRGTEYRHQQFIDTEVSSMNLYPTGGLNVYCLEPKEGGYFLYPSFNF